jgi:hypothetical protein
MAFHRILVIGRLNIGKVIYERFQTKCNTIYRCCMSQGLDLLYNIFYIYSLVDTSAYHFPYNFLCYGLVFSAPHTTTALTSIHLPTKSYREVLDISQPASDNGYEMVRLISQKTNSASPMAERSGKPPEIPHSYWM